jgi:hypothetical protein
LIFLPLSLTSLKLIQHLFFYIFTNCLGVSVTRDFEGFLELFPGFEKYYAHFLSCPGFPATPIVLFADADKEIVHFQFFFKKL